MDHTLDARSPIPLYEQIAGRFRLAIAAAELAPGEALPSVRKLSASLRVNPSTVIQAYRELESGGWVETRHGSGTFVNELSESRREDERREHAKVLVRRLVADAGRLGLTTEEIMEALNEEMGE